MWHVIELKESEIDSYLDSNFPFLDVIDGDVIKIVKWKFNQGSYNGSENTVLLIVGEFV